MDDPDHYYEPSLEQQVRVDMVINGYNPFNKKDIDQYWKERLNDSEC